MGLNCPSSFRKPERSLPVVNMIAVGFKNAGKTSVLAKLGTDHEKTSNFDSPLGQRELQIGSCVLDRRVKVITFEVSSSAAKTWKNYYPNAHILMLIIDISRLEDRQQAQVESLVKVLDQIDEQSSDFCKIIVAFNKIDLKNSAGSAVEKIIVDKMAALRHEVVSVKCSALTGKGLDRLSETIVSVHNTVSL